MNHIISYYDQLASTYDEARFNNPYGKFIDLQERAVLQKLINDKDKVVLDLACGTGRLLNYATHGIDASPEMVRVSRAKFPHKTILVSDAGKLPFEASTFDTIIAFHVFMHLNQSDVEAIISECSRVLKKGGRIIFDIPSKKRRALINYKSNGWHGSLSLSMEEIKNLNKDFLVNRIFGILFLPIQRFPKNVRKYFVKLDYLLGNLFFKKYCSYLIIEYIKK